MHPFQLITMVRMLSVTTTFPSPLSTSHFIVAVCHITQMFKTSHQLIAFPQKVPPFYKTTTTIMLFRFFSEFLTAEASSGNLTGSD